MNMDSICFAIDCVLNLSMIIINLCKVQKTVYYNLWHRVIHYNYETIHLVKPIVVHYRPNILRGINVLTIYSKVTKSYIISICIMFNYTYVEDVMQYKCYVI